MAETRHRVGIKGSLPEIYEAVIQPAGLAGWWATSASGTPNVGGELVLEFTGLPNLSFQILELVPHHTVALECVSGPGPWLGSQLRFELQEADGQVFTTLTHSGLDPDDESFLYFSTKWPVYLLSLKSFVETGRGTPYPNEAKIYHVG